jgi:hypothetical protein
MQGNPKSAGKGGSVSSHPNKNVKINTKLNSKYNGSLGPALGSAVGNLTNLGGSTSAAKKDLESPYRRFVISTDLRSDLNKQSKCLDW